MSYHKTETFHSENGNTFVAKVIKTDDEFQVFLTINDTEEILKLRKKDGKITHTTGDKA